MEYLQFFRRKPLEFDGRFVPEYIPAHCENVNEFLYAPVITGVWRQCELWDGTYTLDDLMDAHEIMRVKAENQRRAEDAARKGRS